MKSKPVIFLALAAALPAAIILAWPNIEFWSITGHFFPIHKIDTLQHPVQVSRWTSSALILADGRTVPLLGANPLPQDCPALQEALKRGVELTPDGQIWTLVRIHHWCGNDPVREHIVRLDLAELMIFLRLANPTTPIKEPDLLAQKPGGTFSQWGWDISEFMHFQTWQSYARAQVVTQTDK